jgi:GDP-4-dehydro-6-deoxy-D-mannose reductase
MQSERESGIRLRILITGAYGFAGRHLIANLLAASDRDTVEIVAAVHSEPSSAESAAAAALAGWDGRPIADRVVVTPLDVRDEKAVTDLIVRVRPHQIYHLAGRSSGADTDREAVFAINVTGTRNLLEAASLLSPFPRVLIVSTVYVYGNTNPERPAREEDPIGPLWRFGPYTDSKIEMENVAKAYRGLVLVARSGAHAGPGQMPAFAIPAFARQLARIERGMEPPQLHVGNLEAQRDLLDVRDVVRAYRLLMAQGVCGQTYNVTTGQPVTIRAALDGLRALCTVPTEIALDPARLRPADIACATGDPSRLRSATGWRPQYTLEETLRATLDYWRAITALPDAK